jgi:hypothetical protein
MDFDSSVLDSWLAKANSRSLSREGRDKIIETLVRTINTGVIRDAEFTVDSYKGFHDLVSGLQSLQSIWLTLSNSCKSHGSSTSLNARWAIR